MGNVTSCLVQINTVFLIIIITSVAPITDAHLHHCSEVYSIPPIVCVVGEVAVCIRIMLETN